ncbi:glycosyltransferase family 2 protein [Mesorhizobium sp. LjNodule214]|uniref:glycosyltransferase family 2 protein n=1 Tax=Mesorhizobium sp. LjNodule214 TaxID=3342252 RepID=UPI003ECCF790
MTLLPLSRPCSINGELVTRSQCARYNRRDAPRCARSVLSCAQIIVVDDGSRDQIAAIARCHAEIDTRVRLIEQANAGVAAARNTGWRAARSNLIAFASLLGDLGHG